MRRPLVHFGREVSLGLLLAMVLLTAQGCALFGPFRADSGEPPLVGEISFEGNKAIPDGELRGKIALTESGRRYIVKIGNAYTFEAAGLKSDRQRIERYYHSHGYFSARVTDVRTQLDKGGGRMNITFVIDEGPPTIVEKITPDGIDEVPPELRRKVLAKLPVKEGEIFKEQPYEATKVLVRDRLMGEGFMQAEVGGTVEVDRDAQKAHVILNINPGKRFRVGQIRIDGILGPKNDPDVSFDRTRDATLLKQGDLVTPHALTRARDKVAAMGVFSSVEVTPSFDPASGTAVVLVKVTEAPFQTIETGVGIEADQLRQLGRASLRYTNKNVGRGLQKVIAGGSLGYAFLPSIFKPVSHGIIGDATLQYIQPRIFRRSIDAQAAVDYTKDLLPAFRFQRLGARAGLLLYLDNVKGLSFAPSINYEYYFDVASGPNSADRQRQNTALVQSGCGPDPRSNALSTQCVLGYVEGQLNYDLRDNVLQPRKGAFFSFNVQYAGLPFSEFKYLRFLPEGRIYTPVPGTNRRLIFAGRLRYGLLRNIGGAESRQPPGVAFFFAGGANSVRAAGTQQMGPLIYSVLDDSKAQPPFKAGVPIPLGGDRLIEGSLELRWYTPIESLGLVFFFDAGRLYRTDTNVLGGLGANQQGTQFGPGLGVRYNTPLGPLRVDVAYRLSRMSLTPSAIDTAGVENPATVPDNLNFYSVRLDCPADEPFNCYSENRINFYITLGEAF